MGDPPVSLIVDAIQPTGRRGAWHGGPTPLGALRGVTVQQALWAPAPRRKSIWALTLHLAYWKYAVRRQLEGSERGAFPRRPANWPVVPAIADVRSWLADVALLRAEHERLLGVAKSLDLRQLQQYPRSARRWTRGELLVGIAMHDAYHTGQIQMLKRLWRERSSLLR